MQLALLGPPCLRLEGLPVVRIERKVAGLLAYLALEGETGRSRLAGLLWPHVPEVTARNNLAQTIKRLRATSPGPQLLEGQDRLSLMNGLACDARAMLADHKAGRLAQVAEYRGELLASMDYGNCPDFQGWLSSQRARLEDLRRQALASLSEAAESDGDHHAALSHAKRLVDSDPCSETAHQRLIRLYWQAGDRAAAMRAYEQCRLVLQHELGVLPSQDTLALIRSIGQGAAPAAHSAAPLRRLPPAFLRPPVLVGRAAELARMEAAWARGQAIFLGGPAGVGKTRLMQEFLGAKGRFFTFEGRPEDRAVPFSNHARTCRQMLRAFPGIRLPDWVRQEMARFLPELGPQPGPFASEGDKLRFFQAVAEMTRLTVDAGMRLVAMDDLQFVDLPSLEVGHFVFGQHWGRGDGLRTVLGFRPDELAPEAAQAMAWALDRGHGVLIDLDPLSMDGLAALLESLDAGLAPLAAGLAPLAGALYRHTGGNPLFALETVKSLHRSGELANGPPGRLPVPDQVRALLEQRLARLTPRALEQARAAAVAGEHFTAQLAARMLGVDAPRLVAPWAELEAARILADGRLVHALFQEVFLAGLVLAAHSQIAAASCTMSVTGGDTLNVTQNSDLFVLCLAADGVVNIAHPSGEVLLVSANNADLGGGLINHGYSQPAPINPRPTYFDLHGTTRITLPTDADRLSLRAHKFDSQGMDVINHGTVILSGGGKVQLQGKANLVNAVGGTFYLEGETAGITTNSIGYAIDYVGDGFINRGVVSKLDGVGVGSLSVIDAPIRNIGDSSVGAFASVEVLGGNLLFKQGGYHHDVKLYADPMDTLHGGRLQFDGGHTFSGNVLTESGAFSALTDSRILVTSGATWQQRAEFDASGDIYLAAGATLENTQKQDANGIFLGGGNVQIFGTLSGAGMLHNQAGGQFYVSGNYSDGKGILAQPTGERITVVNEGLFLINPMARAEVAGFINRDGDLEVHGELENVGGTLQLLGGRLMGNGIINGDVFVGGGPGLAQFTPGSSPGTMAIDGNLELRPGGVLELEVGLDAFGGIAFDQVVVSGTILLDGLVKVIVDPSLVESDVLGISFFDCGGACIITYGSSFAWSFPGRDGSTLSFDNGVSIQSLAPVPEPQTWAMLLAGLGLVRYTARRRRSA